MLEGLAKIQQLNGILKRNFAKFTSKNFQNGRILQISKTQPPNWVNME